MLTLSVILFLNFDEIPEELLCLIFLKSSKAPSNPKEIAIYKQNKILIFVKSPQNNTDVNKPKK